MTGFKRIIPGTIDTGFPCIYDPDSQETVCQIYGANANMYKDVSSEGVGFSHIVVIFLIYFPAAYILSSALYVYVNAKFIEYKHEDEECVEEVAYENKYPINNEDDIGKGEGRISETAEQTSIIEYVPDIGNVVMCYNKEKEGFNYWADRNIPHRFLLTVCRKYVKSLQCEYLYVCEDKEDEKDGEDGKEGGEGGEGGEEEKVETKKEETVEKPKKEETSSVFATFKNYKTEGNPNKKKDTEKGKKMKGEGKLVTKKINNFIYKGKINNFSMLSSQQNDDESKSGEKDASSWFTPISFEDFKRMSSKKE